MLELILYIEPQEPLSDYELGRVIRWLFYFVCIYFFFKMLNHSKQERNQEKDNKPNNTKTVLKDSDFKENSINKVVKQPNSKDELAPDLDSLIWDSIETAFKYNWCVEAYVINVKDEYLDLILLLPDDLNLPLKERMQSYKRGRLYAFQYSGKLAFDEIDKTNFIGSTINTLITSINKPTKEILLKPYNN